MPEQSHPRSSNTPLLDLHDELRQALASGDIDRVRQVRGAMDLRAKAIKAVSAAINHELMMDPGAASYGFSADSAARVIGAYEDALR